MGSSGAEDGSERRLVRPPKPGAAMSLTVLLMGLAIVGLGSYTFVYDSARLDDSVEVTAEITDLGVEEVQGSRGRQAYIPRPTFEYRFEGVTYTSDRIYPGVSQPRYDDRATAQSRLSAFAVGDSVTAYVDPDAPGQAFLENARSGHPTGAVLFGVVLSAVAGWRLRQVWGRSHRPVE